MPDNLTQRVKEELRRRGTIVSDAQVELFLKSKGVNIQGTSPAQPMQTLASQGIEMADDPMVRAQKDNVLDLVGSTFWHAFDTALFGVPGIAMGEDAPYQFGEMGAFGNIGAVFGEAAGFLAPIGAVGKLTAKGVQTAGKYGTKAATKRASEAASKFAGGAKNINAQRAGQAVQDALKTREAKGYLARYGQDINTIRSVENEVASLIRGQLKKQFPNAGDDLINNITISARDALSKEGAHINNISSWVSRSLGTRFNTSDKSFINSYIGRATELTANFAIVNLIDDGIKSALVEGHEFDPIADVGHALMFSALLPAVEAFPGGGKMRILRTRKDVRKGLEKIRTMDYDKLDIDEINAIFRIISNNNRIKNSTFARESAKNYGNAFTSKQKDLAVKELKDLFNTFRPEQVWRELRGQVRGDIVQAIPRMALGAAYFNAATLMDADLLRNIEPEILGAHLLTGALFTKRYKPIVPEKYPTLNDFEQKIEFLKIMGMEGEQIKALGTSWGMRGDMAAAYSGLLQHPIMRQISESFNTKENREQSAQGKNNVSSLSDPHSFVSQIEPLYILAENSRKIGKAEANVNPDVNIRNLTHEQIMNIDRKLREINIEEWMGEGFNVKRLNEQNFADAREKIFEDISLNTYNNFMTLVERGMRALGVQVDKQPGEAFDINKSINVGEINGLKQFDNVKDYEGIRQLVKLSNRLEGLGFINRIKKVGSTEASKIENPAEISAQILKEIDMVRRRIKEDNYDAGVESDGLVDIADNQFLESLKSFKRIRSFNTFYNFTEGRTAVMKESDVRTFYNIRDILGENKKFEVIEKPKEMELEKWEKIELSNEYFELTDKMNSLSDMLNVASRGIQENVKIDYYDAKRIVESVESNGFKLDADMKQGFEAYYYDRLLNSSGFGIKHIAVIKNGLENKVFRIEEINGRRTLIVPDKSVIERALNTASDMSKEERVKLLDKYESIDTNMNAINGSFMQKEKFETLSETNRQDIIDFIKDSYAATVKVDKDIITEYRKIQDNSRERMEVMDTLGEIVENLIDTTDPNNPVSKKITYEEALEFSQSIDALRRESKDKISAELASTIDLVSKKLQNINVGEDGMLEPGNALLSLRELLNPRQFKEINMKVAEVVFNLQNNSSDRIAGKIRMDKLMTDLSLQLNRAGIKVEENSSLSQLESKFFNSGLSVTEKLEKGIKLSLTDFINTIDLHRASWYSAYTEAEFNNAREKALKTYEDSSLQSRNIETFKKWNSTINKLSEYNDYFKVGKGSEDGYIGISATKGDMKLSLIKADEAGFRKSATEVLDNAKIAYDNLHKDSPSTAAKEFKEFQNSAFKDFLFATAGNTSISSVKLSYADGRYVLRQGKSVASEFGTSKFMKDFHKANVFMAVLEKEGTVLGENGLIKRENNLFAVEDFNSRYLANAGFGYDKDVAKNIERGIETLSPEGTDFLRVPMSFNTQMIVSTKGSEITRATPLIYEWYTKKRKTLKDAVENQEIKQSVLSNFESLFKSVVEKNGEARDVALYKNIELKQVLRSMYWDKMNSKGFNRLIELATNQGEMEIALGSMFKYLSISEGIGAKTNGNEMVMESLLKLNKNKEYSGEILSERQVEAIDYYFNKKKELKNNPLEIISINDSKNFDTYGIVVSELKRLKKKYPNLKASVNESLANLEADVKSSTKGKSSIDAATYVGNHLWELSLLHKGREFTDGSGGVKESISFNDGINTMLLKQNFTYDPNIARVINRLGIDIITFDSAAKEFSKKQIDGGKWKKGTEFSKYLSEALGSDIKSLRKDNVQNVSIEDILFMKSEDRKKVVSITHAMHEFLGAEAYQNFLKDYAKYDNITNASNELMQGLTSKRGSRLGAADFIFNMLAEDGSLLEGSTNSYVRDILTAGGDPKSVLIKDAVSRAAYRTIINRIRKPETEGGSYATMIPYLEGSMPLYDRANNVQIRYGGKKLPYADGRFKVQNFDQLQYIVDVGGREVLVGREIGPNNKIQFTISNEKNLKLTSKEIKELKNKQIEINDIIKKFPNGGELSILHEQLLRKNIWIESLSLRMPNLGADVAVHKIEGFYNKDMGNVVGVNVHELATKHQGDFDADMMFNYHDTKMRLTDGVARLSPLKGDAYVYEARDYDFGDIFNNRQSLEPVGSLSDPIDSIDRHNISYHKSKANFGIIKRISTGINSLNRIDMKFGATDKKILKLEGKSLEQYIQRQSNVLQSLIDTTKRPNYLSVAESSEILRFVLFGEKPKSLNIDLAAYNEAGYTGLLSEQLNQFKTSGEKEVFRDAMVELVNTLGRPSRILSDIHDASGRRTPEHRDLIDMKSELSLLANNPSQFLFNKLNSKYRNSPDKQVELIKMFFDVKKEPVRELQDKMQKSLRKRQPLKVEKNVFFNKDVNSVFDSTPAGYVLNRIGNINNTYDRAKGRYGAEVKKLAETIDNVENLIALSNAESHQEMIKNLKEFDKEDNIMIGLTGNSYKSKATDLAYIQNYSIAYNFLRRNSNDIREQMRRNSKSNSSRAVYLRNKLNRIDAIMKHMESKEDGIIGEMVKGENKE